MVLKTVCYWPSSHCIPAHNRCPCRRSYITTVRRSVGLRQGCVLSPLLFIFYIRGLQTTPRGPIRPTKPFHPAAKHILPI